MESNLSKTSFFLDFVYGKHRLQVLNTAVHSKIVTYDELWLSFYVLCDLVSSHLEIPFSNYSYNLPSSIRRHVQEMIFKYLSVKPVCYNFDEIDLFGRETLIFQHHLL